MYRRRDDATGLYGYWKRDGWAIDPRFQYVANFLSGYASVDLVDGRQGLVNTLGAIFPLDEICGGRPRAEGESSVLSFVDLEERPSRYLAVRTTYRGRSEWGLIDTDLTYRPLPEEVFSSATLARPFGEYIVVYRTGDSVAETTCGLFNLRDGHLDLPIEYSCIYPSRESLWVVCRPGRDDRDKLHFAFYDPRKREVLPGWYWGALPFSCGLGAIREEHGSSYFVDESLRPAFDAGFDDMGRFSCGLAAVYDGDDAGYIDTTGRMRLLLPYARLQPFNEFGLAIANRDELEWDIDIIDRAGRPRLAGLATAVYWDGDFPYFEVSKDDDDYLFDPGLNLLFQCR